MLSMIMFTEFVVGDVYFDEGVRLDNSYEIDNCWVFDTKSTILVDVEVYAYCTVY